MMVGSLPVAAVAPRPPLGDRPPVWLDCDVGPDTDDMVHINLCIYFHKRGIINLIGLSASSYGDAHGPALRGMLDAHGLTNTLVGVQPAGPVSSAFTARLVPRYHPGQTSAAYPTAAAALRQGLAAQPDKSVWLLSGGGLTAQQALLQSPGDGFDSRNGHDLVAAKVKQWAGMIGFINYSSEYNVELDRPAAVYVAANWPTPMDWHGGAFGGSSYDWPDIVKRGCNDWKNPHAYCYMTSIHNTAWDIACLFNCLFRNAPYSYPRMVNATISIDPASGTPTMSPSPAGNRRWIDLVLGQGGNVGGYITHLLDDYLLPVDDHAIPPSSVSLDFINKVYKAAPLADLACTGAAGRTALNADGSTVTFAANQLRLTDQGLYCAGDLVEITGATFGAMNASQATVVLQTNHAVSPGGSRTIGAKNATVSSYYYLDLDSTNAVTTWFGAFDGASFLTAYLPSGQSTVNRTISAFQWDGTGVRVAANGAFSDVTGRPMLFPTNLYLGSNPTGGEYFTGFVEKLTVYPGALSAAQVVALTTLGP